MLSELYKYNALLIKIKKNSFGSTFVQEHMIDFATKFKKMQWKTFCTKRSNRGIK